MDRPAPEPAARRPRRVPLWGVLVVLLVVAQSLLVALTLNYESTRAQDAADTAAADAATEMKRELLRSTQALQQLSWRVAPHATGLDGAADLLRQRRELLHVERRDPALAVVAAEDSPFATPLFQQLPRSQLGLEAELACTAARRQAGPAFSRSYFVPLPEGRGQEVMDLCMPMNEAGREAGFLVGTFSLAQLLESALPTRGPQRHELTFVEPDGTRLARAGGARGAGVYVAERPLDLPGTVLQLRADGTGGRPSLIPNLATALVLGLSIALFGVVLALARDVRRRARAEGALAEALSFRKAMEDSLVTGLRARDLQGRITYVNPAFCAMVGFGADELQSAAEPPYWPPEHAAFYAERQRARLAGAGRDAREAREGFETVFMRKSGERFPVMIYEAPLVDGQGRQAGWMSAVLDVSEQRRIEDLSRQQQDRLQAAARLATVGEMASLLSHELNQPLAAIASYASGSINLMEQPDEHTPGLLRQALERIAEQAERAGRIIKSVHHFVRRRERQHEAVRADQLIDAVLPLVRLQARKSGTRVELQLPEKPPRVTCDRTLLEQVLLNLTRNGIQAMEEATPLAERVLAITVRQTHPRWVTFHVADAGPGIAPEVAQRLFTPFYTTRSEGMGLGLSLCRTVIEQHGGALDFGAGPGGRGTEFRFSLPAARAPGEGSADAPLPSSATAP